MQVGRKIGEGGNSHVYEWGNDQVLKLGKPGIEMSELLREYKNTLMVWEMGLPVPRPYEMAEYHQRPGIIFERINGITLRERLFRNVLEQTNSSDVTFDWEDVRKTARLLSKIHQLSHEDLPSQREYLKRQIQNVHYLSREEKEQIINHLEQLQINYQVCHGDPNPNNILINNGNLIMIDWNDTTSGNPEADIAEYILMMKFAILPPDTPQSVLEVFETARETIIQAFMDEYTRLTEMTYAQVDPWILPIAARKLSADAIVEEEKQLLLQEIKDRLERVNTN